MRRFTVSRSVARGRKKKPGTEPAGTPTAEELDRLHDNGADISSHLDLENARRPGRQVQRVNVDFPVDLLREIDREARRIGVTRQAFIKLRLADVVSGHVGAFSSGRSDLSERAEDLLRRGFGKLK